MLSNSLDIVYVVKGVGTNEELKYSLRSIENLPHRNVYIYGDLPDWATNVKWVDDDQDRRYSEWLNVNNSLKLACLNQEISEDFIFFNDDFFVLEQTESINWWYHKTLIDKADSYLINGIYSDGLRKTSDILKKKGFEAKNFELHYPCIFNKRKLLEILEEYPDTVARRSIYANMFVDENDKIEMKDCKIYTLKESIPDSIFASTVDINFKYGMIGREIRKKFSKKGVYEK